MPDQLTITDDALHAAATSMVSASETMSEGNEVVPATNLESLTGIDGEVRRFLNGLQTGRLALADAAKTSAGAIAGVMSDSGELDARAAQALSPGFAVPGDRR
ncbi:MAG: hypothetical protein QM606_06825 [Leucobacter sp.]